MAKTEHRIYECLAQIARMDRIALILSTPVPTPELLLQFLQSVIKAEHQKRADEGNDEEVRIHLLTPTDSLRMVQ
ncbi:MAG TPA: hypothetical protein VGK99_10170 [Acidobacteriota bacterium]